MAFPRSTLLYCATMLGFRLHRLVVNVALLLVTSVISLIVLEWGLGAALPHFHNYFVWRPHMQIISRPLPEYLPGISGESRFFTNAIGLRGDELSPEDADRILVIGGCTAECLYLDQDETWEALLQKDISAASGRRVWVGNAGKSGISTLAHVVQLRHLLPQLSNVSRVVALVGVNDFIDRLAEDDAFQPNISPVESTPDVLVHAFDVIPRYADTRLPFYKRTRFWFLLTKVKLLYFSRKDFQDRAGELYAKQRANRKQARVREMLPDLSSALMQYRARLNQMVDEAERQAVPITLMTQPSIWRKDLPQEAQDLLWFGWVGMTRWESGEYYSITAMEEGMEKYNEMLLQVCAERKIDCIDLASLLPKDTALFYDDVHFNEEGARRVAAIVGEHLLRDMR